MILLGGPFAAAVAAKGLTSAKVDAGDITKTAEDPLVGGSATESLTTGVMQAVGNDSGGVDLVDFQYFLFNLLALTYFLGNFIPHVAQGFPTIPSVLVALTGTSAAGYVGKKAVEKSSPTIIAMQPAILTPGATVEVWGRWLVVKDAQGNLVPPSVSVGQTVIPAAREGHRIKGQAESGGARRDREAGGVEPRRPGSPRDRAADHTRALAGDDAAHRDERRRLRGEDGHRPRGLIATAARRAGRRRTRAPRAWPGARARLCRRRPCWR